MERQRTSGLALLLAIGAVLSCSKREASDPAYVKAIEEWHRNRIERLKRPDGWLSLVGLHWLREGENRFGSDPSNDIVFPDKAPPFIGTYIVADSVITVRIREGVPVMCEGSRVREMRVKSDAEGEPTTLRWGTLSWYVIRRGDRYAIRVKDSESRVRLRFTGIDMFPIDERWRVRARFEPYEPPKKVPVTTVVGTVEEMTCPGAVVFQIDGQTYRLDAFGEPGDASLFIVFGDATNGRETYGAGRFLSVEWPGEDGTTWVDFNKAYNPPCAFTPYATCPLPPEQNILPIRIPAGEKKYGKGHS